MINEKHTDITNELIRLANILDSHYNLELNFRNHCYLRIAYDNVVQDKWDKKVNKPFIKNAKECQLMQAINLLNKYFTDKETLLTDNEKSLAYRRKEKKLKKINTNSLF